MCVEPLDCLTDYYGTDDETYMTAYDGFLLED